MPGAATDQYTCGTVEHYGGELAAARFQNDLLLSTTVRSNGRMQMEARFGLLEVAGEPILDAQRMTIESPGPCMLITSRQA
jgi:hypothetical protein